jgi:hypothetical protein
MAYILAIPLSQPENFTTQRKDCNNDSIANGLEQAQKCGRIKLINRIPILLSVFFLNTPLFIFS